MDNQLQIELINLLCEHVPLRDRNIRDTYLLKLPHNIQDLIVNRSDSPKFDLRHIINTVKSYQLENGRWVILILIDAFLQDLEGLKIYEKLQALREKIEEDLLGKNLVIDQDEPIQVKSEDISKVGDEIYQDYARIIQRDDMVNQIKEYFEQESREGHFIVVYGQPMVGKTRLLSRLARALDDQYVPLMVTGQGLELNNTLVEKRSFKISLAQCIQKQVNTFCQNLKKTIKDTDDDKISKSYCYLKNYIDKYEPMLFCDPLEVKINGQKQLVFPHRTNNILEQHFRLIHYGYRRIQGNGSIKKHLVSMPEALPIVTNLKNKAYLELVFGHEHNIVQKFAEVDVSIIRQKQAEKKNTNVHCSKKIKKIIREPKFLKRLKVASGN